MSIATETESLVAYNCAIVSGWRPALRPDGSQTMERMMKLTLIAAAMVAFAAPAFAQDATPPALPNCSAKVTDSCQQGAAPAMHAKSTKSHHKHAATKKTTTTTTTTETPASK
jgi:hypothetical protein